MKNIRSFDLFQKVSVENIVKPTLSGAFISLSAILIILFLIFKEITDYFTPSFKKDSIIYNDLKNTQEIIADFSLKLFNVPCSIISIDQEDLIGQHTMDIKKNIIKIRMDKENKVIVGTYVAYKTDLLEKSIKEKEACYIKGYIPISKAPGDFHISFHAFRELWTYLKGLETLTETFSVNHKFFSLSFGDKSLSQKIISIFGENENTKMLINKQLPSFDEEIKNGKDYNYDYYLKLIPHLFIDEYSNKEYMAYQYSISSKSKLVESEDEMPIIMINYDMSPITMKITLKKKYFSSFLIHICAIVGGVFVVFSFINKILLFINDEMRNGNSGSEREGIDKNRTRY